MPQTYRDTVNNTVTSLQPPILHVAAYIVCHTHPEANKAKKAHTSLENVARLSCSFFNKLCPSQKLVVSLRLRVIGLTALYPNSIPTE